MSTMTWRPLSPDVLGDMMATVPAVPVSMVTWWPPSLLSPHVPMSSMTQPPSPEVSMSLVTQWPLSPLSHDVLGDMVTTVPTIPLHADILSDTVAIIPAVPSCLNVLSDMVATVPLRPNILGDMHVDLRGSLEAGGQQELPPTCVHPHERSGRGRRQLLLRLQAPAGAQAEQTARGQVIAQQDVTVTGQEERLEHQRAARGEVLQRAEHGTFPT
ncbi:hypothetical protein TURU_110736 [Turdus rufiventris]|nr:hypothetical protein TURU_110736 [Turdus rufiventris]